jgi:hypothetical protein
VTHTVLLPRVNLMLPPKADCEEERQIYKKVKYGNGRRLCDDIDPSQIIMTAFQNGW